MEGRGKMEGKERAREGMKEEGVTGQKREKGIQRL